MTSETDPLQLAVELARIAEGARCDDVTVLDLRGMSPVTDFFVISTGTSDRQMRTVAEQMVEYGRKVDEKPYGVTGLDAACWILIDFVHVVAHVFTSEHRDYYDLELLWGDAPRIDWRRSASA